MSLTFTVDATPLPLPRADSPWEMSYLPFGAAQRAFSGQLRVQYITSKYKVKINWTGLSAAERASLLSVYGTYLRQAGVWTFPDGLTFTGLIPLASWEQTHWLNPHNGVYYYDVSFTVEQQ